MISVRFSSVDKSISFSQLWESSFAQEGLNVSSVSDPDGIAQHPLVKKGLFIFFVLLLSIIIVFHSSGFQTTSKVGRVNQPAKLRNSPKKTTSSGTLQA